MDVVSSWPWDSQNKLILNNRREKYAVFRNPQVCILVEGGGGRRSFKKSPYNQNNAFVFRAVFT